MSKLPPGITRAQIDEYAKLDNAIKKIAPRHKVLNELIKQKFTKLGVFTFGRVVITRGEAKSFDAKGAEKAYPEDKFPQYYKSVFDPTTLEADKRAKFTSKTQRLSVVVSEEDAS